MKWVCVRLRVSCVSQHIILYILYTTYYIYTCITIMAHYRYYSRVFYLSIIISLPFVFCCSTRKTSIIWFRCHRVYEDMSLYHIVILLWRHFFLVCALYLNFLVDFIIFFFPKENDESAMLEIELYFSFSFWRVRHVNKKMIINTEKMKKKMKYTSRLNRILLIFLYQLLFLIYFNIYDTFDTTGRFITWPAMQFKKG